jgi:hypothetical protein
MKTSLEPAEYDVVQSVFKRPAQASSFDRTASNETACAKLVLNHYSAGATNPVDLLAACAPAAIPLTSNNLEKWPSLWLSAV